jgi:helix-turn-helix protein
MNNNSNGAGGYFRVQDRLFDWYGQLLGPIAIAVYNYLARCAGQNGCCFPSYEDIARKVGISRSSALRAIAKLIKYKLITVKHRRHGQEHRDDHTSNCYKIRLEAFTDKGAHREVVSQGHQLVSQGHQLVSQGHPKDYPIKENPNKEKERGGGIPLSTPPDSLSISSNSPQGGETSKVGGDVEAATAQSAGGDNGLGCQNQAVEIATKANEKPTTGRERQHQGNGVAQPTPVPSTLSDDEIKASMKRTNWSEARVKREALKFRNHHLSKRTLSYSWAALWENWELQGLEYEAKHGKVERTAPRPPPFVAEPKAPIDPSKPRPSHMAMVRAEIAKVAAQP